MNSVIGPGEWARMLGSLALVLALMVAGLWAYRWLQNQTAGVLKKQGRRIVIRETLTLGVRQKLVLLSVDDKTVLVGVTPSGMSALGEWSDDRQRPQLDEVTR